MNSRIVWSAPKTMPNLGALCRWRHGKSHRWNYGYLVTDSRGITWTFSHEAGGVASVWMVALPRFFEVAVIEQTTDGDNT
jgi:hypothetical protein